MQNSKNRVEFMINGKSILVVGSVPPPIGGVSIHIFRLLSRINEFAYFWDHRRDSVRRLLSYLLRTKVVHLHINNPYKRLTFILFCRCLFKKVVMTYHGDLDRYKGLWHVFDIISIYCSSVPLLINKESFMKSKMINRKSTLVSAFIPPMKVKDQNIDLNLLREFCSQHELVCCTNVHNFSYDPDGNETYGIEELVGVMQSISDKSIGLIISDPLGNAEAFFKNSGRLISSNVFFINREHDFNYVLKNSDVLIRNTSTDGDSLSVREGLFFNKVVLATDCVSRPVGCVLYQRGDTDTLIELLHKCKSGEVCFSEFTDNPDGVNDLLEVYQKLL